MQHLFAFFMQQKVAEGLQDQAPLTTNTLAADIQKVTNGLRQEKDKIENLHWKFLQVLTSWAEMDSARQNIPKRGYTHTLADNRLLVKLKQHPTFVVLCEKTIQAWPQDLVEEWYEDILSRHQVFLAYTKQVSPTYKQDVELVKALVNKVFFKHTNIQTYISKQDMYWAENGLIVKHLLLSTIESLAQDTQEGFALYQKDAGENEIDFYTKLVELTLREELAYKKLIKEKVLNWDLERITLLDLTLLKMAFTELLHLKTPVRVCIDEYLDIAKKYSTSKSHLFLNGVLDTLITSKKNETSTK